MGGLNRERLDFNVEQVSKFLLTLKGEKTLTATNDYYM